VISIFPSTQNIESANNLELYPNPAGDAITIGSDTEYIKAEIFDVSGRIVASQYVDDHKIDVSFLVTGNYVLRAYDKERVSVGKFVKK
jgi:hypothetical protein